ncbi:NUDIX hydrolase [Paenibacillus ginsengarvi]|uniref:NUDIX domain-containing protein n=1 Tax=Paenibacillus ginsengarvi TaxID=400777 RepID=A0A3B0BGU4_9BACL|nr:NUDIX hydrolase [Paenibacillus ginsengarvi]RKN71882.1 NUDIX domain-containing protein [Paenibacillus ginsengarvi]
MNENRWLEWTQRIQAIAQTGLTYAKDGYDLERYEELREISIAMMREQTGLPYAVVKELFASETGYPTPKVDVRGVVFQDGKLLLVREKSDGKWTLPGGWADIGYTPKEVAVKEIREESGLLVRAVKLLAVLDKKCHPHPPEAYYIYKLFILCEQIGGSLEAGLETSAAAFFAESELAGLELSLNRATESQIRLMFEYGRNPGKEVALD